MRLGAVTNGIHPCQPLRFGKAEQSKPKTPAQYEKEIAVLQKKYETACMFAAQPHAVDQFVKSAKKSQFFIKSKRWDDFHPIFFVNNDLSP